MIHQAKSYLSHRKNALKKQVTNSTFVEDLLLHVFDKNDDFYSFKAIEFIRESLKMNTTKVTIEDLGAGSKNNNTNERTVRQIIKSSAKAPKYGQLLFRLANYLEINNALELGTSLGISTAYIKKARKSAQVYTLEGATNIVKLAKDNFKLLKLEKLQVIEGNFDETLAPLLKKIEKVDFVFFDGNHREAATLNYFEQCLTKAHNDTVFIFDDIYWSEGMTKAWKIIKENKKVTLTIDVFELGVVLFKKEIPKQNLVINY